MKITVRFFLLALVAYSATLMGIELTTSQDFVRQYFTDIEGDVAFYAINTTLSTFLLAGAALLLMFAALSGDAREQARARWFLISQAGMFAFLAFDDRFQLHEAIAYRIGIGDHFVMLAWVAIEAAFVFGLCRLNRVTLRMAALFVVACGFFTVMLVFDAVVPHDMILRLSIEDLAKTWAAALFLGTGWYAARFHIGFDRDDRTLAQVISGMGCHANQAAAPRGSE